MTEIYNQGRAHGWQLLIRQVKQCLQLDDRKLKSLQRVVELLLKYWKILLVLPEIQALPTDPCFYLHCSVRCSSRLKLLCKSPVARDAVVGGVPCGGNTKYHNPV